MKENGQRLRLLYLYKLLAEQTDDEHCITAQEIIAELERLGIKAERRTIYADIKALNDFGADIIGQKAGRGYEYFLWMQYNRHALLHKRNRVSL